jgi:hypothetical protein
MKLNLPLKPLTYLAFIALLVFGSLTLKDNNLVVTPYSKMGIINLELNVSAAKRDSMLKYWDSGFKKVRIYKDTISKIKCTDGITAVIDQNNADYPFIVSYVLVFLLLLWRLDKKWFFILGPVALVAGLMDVFEDIGINRTLLDFQQHKSLPSPWTIGTFGWIKAILILILIIVIILKTRKQNWLKKLSSDLSKIVALLWQFRISVLTLVLLFAVLNLSDQGQDLLVTINSDPLACICFLLTTSVLALLCWHLPKAIDHARGLSFFEFWLGPVDFRVRTRGKLDIARLLGCAGFLVPATGILQTMDAYHIQYWLSTVPPIVILGSLLLFYAVALQHHWIEHFFTDLNGIRTNRYFLVMLLLIVPVIGLGIPGDNREPYFLAYLSFDLVLLSAAFLITTTLRTCILATAKMSFLKKWPIAPWITFSALALGLFFVACNFPCFLHLLTDSNRFFTMPVVFCAVSGYLLFGGWLMFAGKKAGVQFVSFLLLIAFFISKTAITTYHNAEVIVTKPRVMDSLKQYANRWLTDRHDEIAYYGKDYPILFMSSYGGGIRAAAWATDVTGAIADSVPDLQRHIFSYSGASGGTIGFSLIAGAKSKFPDSLYQKDYLSADIVGLLGRDLLASATGLSNGSDRAKLMEADWERYTQKYVSYKSPFASFWPSGRYNKPLLFSNTYDILSSQKGIVSGVLLKEQDFPGVIRIEQQLPARRDLKLSTGAFLSARFPYVSPVARLQGAYRFTDGGTWENSGTGTTYQVFNVFKRELDSLRLKSKDHVYDHVHIVFVSINSSVTTNDTTNRPGNIFEPLLVPLGLFNVRSGVTTLADNTLNWTAVENKNCSYYKITPDILPIIVQKKVIWPVLPLGWQISDYALTEMRQSAAKDKQIKNLITQFNKK